MKNRLQTILETVQDILNEATPANIAKAHRAARGDEEVAIADVVLRGFTSPKVEEKARRLERRGENRVGWVERGSPTRIKAAGMLKARRARLAQETENPNP